MVSLEGLLIQHPADHAATRARVGTSDHRPGWHGQSRSVWTTSSRYSFAALTVDLSDLVTTSFSFARS